MRSQALTPACFCVGITGSAQYTNKDLCPPYFTRLDIDDRHRGSGIIYEYLVARDMYLPHVAFQRYRKFPVALAEIAIRHPMRVLLRYSSCNLSKVALFCFSA